MKISVLLLLLIAYRSFADRKQVTLSDIRNKWEKSVAPIKTECIKETGVKEELVDEFFKCGKPLDGCSGKCWLNCGFLKLGISNSTGIVDVKKWSDTFDHLDLPLAQKCADIADPDLCQTAYLRVGCVYDDLSKRFPP